MFIIEHPEVSNLWYKDQYLAQLSVENEEELYSLISKLEKNHLRFVVFREPDIENQITAIAIEPSDKTRRLTSSMPLMLKEYNFFNGIDKNTFKREETVYA
jgi:hypothetical protein